MLVQNYSIQYDTFGKDKKYQLYGRNNRHSLKVLAAVPSIGNMCIERVNDSFKTMLAFIVRDFMACLNPKLQNSIPPVSRPWTPSITVLYLGLTNTHLN